MLIFAEKHNCSFNLSLLIDITYLAIISSDSRLSRHPLVISTAAFGSLVFVPFLLPTPLSTSNSVNKPLVFSIMSCQIKLDEKEYIQTVLSLSSTFLLVKNIFKIRSYIGCGC